MYRLGIRRSPASRRNLYSEICLDGYLRSPPDVADEAAAAAAAAVNMFGDYAQTTTQQQQIQR